MEVETQCVCVVHVGRAQGCAALKQWLGQMLTGFRVNAVQDARDRGLIAQEVLA